MTINLEYQDCMADADQRCTTYMETEMNSGSNLPLQQGVQTRLLYLQKTSVLLGVLVLYNML